MSPSAQLDNSKHKQRWLETALITVVESYEMTVFSSTILNTFIYLSLKAKTKCNKLVLKKKSTKSLINLNLESGISGLCVTFPEWS